MVSQISRAAVVEILYSIRVQIWISIRYSFLVCYVPNIEITEYLIMNCMIYTHPDT